MNTIIEVNNVHKTFYVNKDTSVLHFFHNLKKQNKRKIHAVKELSFLIQAGEVVGLIGLNGAGKSTLIKMMTGILQPSGGELLVFGKEPHKNRKENNYKIAAVFGQRCQLRWDLSIKDSYELIKYMYEVSDDVYASRLVGIKESLGLDDFYNQPVRTLSLGQRMRAELGSAFLYGADIVFLDEPTIGMDFFSKEAILDFLKVMVSKGITIILTTHDIEDIKVLCERVIILNQGKKIYDDKVADLAIGDMEFQDIVLTIDKKLESLPLLKFAYEIDAFTLLVKQVKKSQLPQLIEDISQVANIIDMNVLGTDLKSILRKLYKECDE